MSLWSIPLVVLHWRVPFEACVGIEVIPLPMFSLRVYKLLYYATWDLRLVACGMHLQTATLKLWKQVGSLP